MDSIRLQDSELDRGNVIVIGADHPLIEVVAAGLGGSGSPADPEARGPRVLRASDPSALAADGTRLDLAVYLPGSPGGRLEEPDLASAAPVLERLGDIRDCHVILLSSAAIYSPSHRHCGHLDEERLSLRPDANRIARRWLELERLAALHVTAVRLTVLRPTFVPQPGGRDYASRIFTGRVAVTAPGHDPSVQILSPLDLVQAVRLAARHRRGGTYNVAPDSVVPLRQGLRLAGQRNLAVPRWLQRLARGSSPTSFGAASIDQADYVRYPWTVSNRKIRQELGFAPRSSSAAALAALGPSGTNERPASEPEPDFDPFGMDRGYIDARGRTILRFAHDYYWRVELDGIDNVPREGRAILVGVHRGFMPFDGVMTLHAAARHRGRYTRFLIHPTLVKFPFLADFMTRLGGIIACRENADWVLERDGLLGVYPEGVRGAFSYYRNAYRLKTFRRYEFVSMALRNRAPIIPFVTVGSAEIFPILAKIHWRWWRRLTEWPCLPITPTFPLLPLPLPSKWHTRFLEPLSFHESHSPEAADDPATVRDLGREVRARIAETLDEMRRRRKGIFAGSIFEEQRR